jgi:hypothetical protein
VLDNNTNVTSVVVGPTTHTRKDHEIYISGVEQMVLIPPRHYSIISNPVCRNAEGEIELEPSGQVKLRHGDEEIRFQQVCITVEQLGYVSFVVVLFYSEPRRGGGSASFVCSRFKPNPNPKAQSSVSLAQSSH